MKSLIVVLLPLAVHSIVPENPPPSRDPIFCRSPRDCGSWAGDLDWDQPVSQMQPPFSMPPAHRLIDATEVYPPDPNNPPKFIETEDEYEDSIKRFEFEPETESMATYALPAFKGGPLKRSQPLDSDLATDTPVGFKNTATNSAPAPNRNRRRLRELEADDTDDSEDWPPSKQQRIY